jgi:mono/diheme cytochrome c family protein
MDFSLISIHKISVLTFLVIYLVKTLLLLFAKPEKLNVFTKFIKVPEMIISTAFLVTGIWMYAQIGAIKNLQIIKLVAVFASIPLAIIAFKKRNKVLAVVSLVLIIAAYGLAEASKKKPYPIAKVTTSAEDSSMSGSVIYNQQCSRCHGADGQKGVLNATNLKTSVLDNADLIKVITNGRKSMPGYHQVLSPDEIQSVAAYVESLR